MSVDRGAPLVSVVVPVYDVVDFLAEALDSVLAQEGVELDVVVVDDASTDGSDLIAERYASTDPRVRLVRQEHAGLGAARNTGIRHARGELLTFHDSDDVVPPGSYAAMAGSLRASGSDFCIGRLERFDSTRRWTPEWSREVHEHAPRRHVTIDELPLAMKNIIACNRMYRRTFWDEHVHGFPEGTAYEDHLPMLRSFLHGARFDVLDRTTYLWRRREDGTSISQQKADLGNLTDRLAAKETAWELLHAESTPAARQAYVSRVLDLDLSGFYLHAAHASEEYRAAFAAATSRWLERADDESLHMVRTHRKVAAWLATTGHWDALAWLEDGGKRTLRHGARAVDEALQADATELHAATGVTVPPDLLRLSEDQLVLEPELVRVRWSASALELDLEVQLRGARSVPSPESVTVLLASEDAPPMPYEARPQDGAWRASIDLAHLTAVAREGERRLAVEVRATWVSTSRTGGVASVARGSGAAHRRARLVPAEGEEVLVTPSFRARSGLDITVARAHVLTRDLGFAERQPELVLAAPRLAPGAQAPEASAAPGRSETSDAPVQVTAKRGSARPVVAAVVPAQTATSVTAEPTTDELRARLTLPGDVSEDGEPWVVRARLAGGSPEPVLWPTELRDPVLPADQDTPWRWEATARARCVVVPRSALIEIYAVESEGGSLRLDAALVDAWQLRASHVTWSLRGDSERTRLKARRHTDAAPAGSAPAGSARSGTGRSGTRWTVVLDAGQLENGPLTLEAHGWRRRAVAVRLGRELLDEAPLSWPLPTGVVRLVAGGDAQPRLQLT